jgi:hypothetical protein
MGLFSVGIAKTSPITEWDIDFKCGVFSKEHLAKKLWEHLYRITDIGKAERMYDFLCDLKGFEEFLMTCKPFYWSWHKSGYTANLPYDQGDDDCYVITLVREERRITIKKIR